MILEIPFRAKHTCTVKTYMYNSESLMRLQIALLHSMNIHTLRMYKYIFCGKIKTHVNLPVFFGVFRVF